MEAAGTPKSPPMTWPLILDPCLALSPQGPSMILEVLIITFVQSCFASCFLSLRHSLCLRAFDSQLSGPTEISLKRPSPLREVLVFPFLVLCWAGTGKNLCWVEEARNFLLTFSQDGHLPCI